WALRDLGGNVLRHYTNNSGVWTVSADYIYRGGQLLAVETPAGTRHLSLDHLGTPRLLTDNSGLRVAFHTYYPYGQEATGIQQDTLERLKFTAQERDLGDTTSDQDDLDYMHARHYSALTGRFLHPDPLRGNPFRPQSWNRFAYALGNPSKYVDPTGL